MFESIMNFFKRSNKKKELLVKAKSKEAAKERLHLVLMQDRANVSVDFLELMKQEIIDVIKKYIEVDDDAIDVRLTNKENEDGTNGAPALYANIPILKIKNEVKKEIKEEKEEENSKQNEVKNEEQKEEQKEQQDEEQKEEQNENQNEEPKKQPKKENKANKKNKANRKKKRKK